METKSDRSTVSHRQNTLDDFVFTMERVCRSQSASPRTKCDLPCRSRSEDALRNNSRDHDFENWNLLEGNHFESPVIDSKAPSEMNTKLASFDCFSSQSDSSNGMGIDFKQYMERESPKGNPCIEV